ncbi:MAG: polysaccharide pyruvyl transferase family protein [Caldilineaceae bacterium]|nr:polysaccharide pyruvyl transferase family protein [Caldilineaceae bacterium]
MNSIIGNFRRHLPSSLWNLIRPGAQKIRSQVQQYHFVRQWQHLKGRRKIVYALVPHPALSNIGDHAQVVAIQKWIHQHFPSFPVLEVDKLDVLTCIEILKKFVTPQDLILIHSGGNLGDRGITSEKGRRLLIESFPDNLIISLPQTIHFSQTTHGQSELASSTQVYNAHSHLTVLARDSISGEFARQYFPQSHVDVYPDFVLSLPGEQGELPVKRIVQKVLLCLRNDSESNLSIDDHRRIVNSLPYETTLFDTTFRQPIQRGERERKLQETLELFRSHDAVVTDRFHGLIFAVLMGLPTVVLKTVDHKLTSGLDWFEEITFVTYAESLDEIEQKIQESLSASSCYMPDWNHLYFDPLAAYTLKTWQTFLGNPS